jgi:hypothetical protein
MSAYGAITRPVASALLAPTIWGCTPNNKRPNLLSKQLTIHHLTLATARSHQGLVDYLHTVLALDIEAGRTYPQETLEGEGVFEAYFFAADVFLAIVGDREAIEDVKEVNVSVEDSRNGRSWDDCVAGFYYVSFCRNGADGKLICHALDQA